MRFLALILTLIPSFLGYSQVANHTISWYKMLTGKIDKYGITMHLHKSGHTYSGYYYYDAQQQPIYLIGEDTTVKGKVTLISFSTEEDPEQFSFALTDQTILGVWKKTETAKPLAFSASQVQTPVKLINVFTFGSTKLRPNRNASPIAEFFGSSIWPEDSSLQDRFIRQQIRQMIEPKAKTGDIGKILLDDKKQYFAEYISTNKEAKEKDLKESLEFYNWDRSYHLSVAYLSPNLLTMALSTSSYSGGAHGNHATSFCSLDLVNNRKLELRDILQPSGVGSLKMLLERSFRAQYHLKPTAPLTEAGLFENKIEPNKNFYVTGKGIGFSYSPYEIGPYAMSEINIFISFKDVESTLQPDFKKLIGL